MKETLTAKDIEAIRLIVQEENQKGSESLRRDFAQLQSSVDGYMKKSQDWREEFHVLRAQHKRVKEILIEKGVASEEEFAVIDLS